MEEGLIIKTLEIQNEALSELGIKSNNSSTLATYRQGYSELGLVKEAKTAEEDEQSRTQSDS